MAAGEALPASISTASLAEVSLGVDAQTALVDVPVDHHAVAAIAGVELGHQIGVPGGEPLGVRCGAGGLAPPRGVAGLQGGVHYGDDRLAEILAGHVSGPDMPASTSR